jgi:L-iditol 2-dehydrogenase
VLRGVRRAGLPESVAEDPEPAVALVLGAGSMGLLHLLVLRAVVPTLRVVVSDPVAVRRELALELGAAGAVAPGDETRRVVGELSRGLGAEAVFDCAGGAAALADGLACSREGGAVVLFAHGGAGERADFELDHLFKHERRLLGTYSSGLAEQAAIFELLVAGRLDPAPLATHRLPLSRFAEAVALSEQRIALKVLLTPD